FVDPDSLHGRVALQVLRGGQQTRQPSQLVSRGRHDRELAAGMNGPRQVTRVVEPPARRDELFAQEPVHPSPAGQPLHDGRVERGAHARLSVGPAYDKLDELDSQAELSQPARSLASGKKPCTHPPEL